MKKIPAYLFTFLLSVATTVLGQGSDALLRRVMNADRADRSADGQLAVLTADEHLNRADAYMANRLFPQAREHWEVLLDKFPADPDVPKALFGMGRSYMWERDYAQAVVWFDKLLKDHMMTKEGRDGLAFKGASLVRLGKDLEAADAYKQYTVMFPQGERIESAYLNLIDAYREAGQFDNAQDWVDKTTTVFKGKPAEVNALHAKLRFEIFRKNWTEAVKTADTLLSGMRFAGSMTSVDEVKYLKAFALKRSGQKNAADLALQSLSGNPASYFFRLAQAENAGRIRLTANVSKADPADYPVLYRDIVLKNAKRYNIDPRFLLAIMKQESSFNQTAKSPAGARGLLQLVFDTALKYNAKAGYPSLQPDDLYDPATNIALGTVYIAELKNEFSGLYEGIAASYNGGEDNALRWWKRSNPQEAGIFAAEVGFAETKNYVFKVMTNYRFYCDLYTEDLIRK